MAVLDLLEALHQAIWDRYDRELVPIIIADLNAPPDDPWPEDDAESRT